MFLFLVYFQGNYMQEKIEFLTKEQEAKLPSYRKKWIDIGLCQEPIDYERSKEYITAQYIQQKLEPPEFKYSRSPKESKEILGKHYSLDAACYGHHDSGWLCFYDFFKEEIKLDCVNELSNLIELSKVCGWWYPFDTLCVIEERPKLKMQDMPDGSGMKWCHSEDSLAIEYPDGWGIAIVEGKRIPNSKWITNPESITIDDINNTNDNDLLSVLIERYGWGRYMSDINAEAIDSRENYIDNTLEALYSTDKMGLRLLVTCPTGRMFALPIESGIKTCLEAQNFIGDVSSEDSMPNVIART